MPSEDGPAVNIDIAIHELGERIDHGYHVLDSEEISRVAAWTSR